MICAIWLPMGICRSVIAGRMLLPVKILFYIKNGQDSLNMDALRWLRCARYSAAKDCHGHLVCKAARLYFHKQYGTANIYTRSIVRTVPLN